MSTLLNLIYVPMRVLSVVLHLIWVGAMSNSVLRKLHNAPLELLDAHLRILVEWLDWEAHLSPTYRRVYMRVIRPLLLSVREYCFTHVALHISDFPGDGIMVLAFSYSGGPVVAQAYIETYEAMAYNALVRSRLDAYASRD